MGWPSRAPCLVLPEAQPPAGEAQLSALRGAEAPCPGIWGWGRWSDLTSCSDCPETGSFLSDINTICFPRSPAVNRCQASRTKTARVERHATLPFLPGDSWKPSLERGLWGDPAWLCRPSAPSQRPVPRLPQPLRAGRVHTQACLPAEPSCRRLRLCLPRPLFLLHPVPSCRASYQPGVLVCPQQRGDEGSERSSH